MSAADRALSPLKYFYEKVEQYPRRRALVCGSDALTFLNLDRLSSRLANLMLEKGVSKGDPIGILVNKDVRTIIAILASWKIGSPFVPVDIESPKSRIDHILKTCGIEFTVVDEWIYNSISGHVLKDTFCVVLGEDSPGPTECTAPWKEILKYPAEKPAMSHSTEDLAYVIFTSGSTGQPKGVMISNGNLSHFIDWCMDVPEISAGAKMLNIANFSFDQSILDLAMLIGPGVELHLFNSIKHPLVLIDYIEKNEIGILSTVPTIWGMLFDDRYKQPDKALSTIKKAFIGGAACPPSFLPFFHEKVPGADVFNMYGPTEITVYCLFHKFSQEELVAGINRVPIGRPFRNHRADILYENSGESDRGELTISGPQVMTGYWSEDKGPFRTDSSTANRTYLTGDIVERDVNGIYYFVGRRNETIKSGGHRIDLIEIEKALLLNPFITGSAVVAVPDELLENRIIAFVTTAEDTKKDDNHILDSLAQVLPKYMLPEQIIFADEFPLSSSGKIDKKRLRSDFEFASEPLLLESF